MLALLLILTAVSGAATLYIPAFSVLPTAILAVLVIVGLGALTRLNLPASVAAPIIVFVFLTGMATVTALFTTSTEFAVRGATGLLGCVGAMCATAIACRGNTGSDDARRRVILWVLAVISCITAAWALRQSILGFTSAELASIYAQGSTYLVGDQIRSSGLFGVNQEFGLFSACLTPALLALAIRNKRYRGLYVVAFALLATAMLVSLTRTAIVAAGIASVVAVILNAPGRNVILRALSSVILVGSLVAVAYWALSSSTDPRVQAAVDRIETLLNVREDGSFNARLDYVWQRGIDLMIAHPFGLGAGAAGPVSSRFPDVAPAGNVTVDQGYIMIGVQLGWAGVLVFVWMLLALLFWLGRSVNPTAKAAAMALLALMIAMTASQYWSLSAPIMLVGGVLGVGMAGALSEQQPPGALRAPSHTATGWVKP